MSCSNVLGILVWIEWTDLLNSGDPPDSPIATPLLFICLSNYIYLQFQNLESEVMEALCNVQWFFFLFHQIFFALVPGLMLRYEMILGNPQSGVLYLRQISEQSWNKIKVSKSRKQFMVSSILPKNERKQFDLRYHSSKVEFFVPFLEELRRP